MKKLILVLFTLILSVTLLTTVTEAKRFGGGISIGKQRMIPHNYASKPNRNAANATQATQQSGMSRWLGPLAGFALGGLLASLFMGHLGSMSLLMLLLGALGIWAFSRYKQKSISVPQNLQYVGNSHSIKPDVPNALWQNQNGEAFSNQKLIYPPSFDPNSFLHQVKTHFIRMQAAYDQSNLSDIREFTTPEMFAEIRLQLQERGNQNNVTDVVTLNAEIVDFNKEDSDYIISVRFMGTIREEENSVPNEFCEIWHFQKNLEGGLLVTGIQQV